MSEIVGRRVASSTAHGSRLLAASCDTVNRFLGTVYFALLYPRPNEAFAEVITLLNSLAAWAASDGARHPFAMSPVACLPLAQGAGYRE